MLESLFGKEFYNAYFHYIVGVSILILGVFVGHLVVSILRSILIKESTTSEVKQNITSKMSKINMPVNLVFFSIAVYAVHKLGDFPREFDPYIWHSVKVVLDISFFMILYHFIGAAVYFLMSKISGDSINNSAEELISNAAKMVIAILGVVTVLGNFNINIGPVLGGLTVLTSAVALAARESIKGFMGSLTVILEGKFQQGDWIKIDDTQGFVEHIGIRATSIRGLDKTLTVIPNDKFVESSITNYSKTTHWAIHEEFILDHSATQHQLETIVSKYREWLINNPDIESDPKKAGLIVRIDNLEMHGFSLLLKFFTKTNLYPEHLRVREAAIFGLLKIVHEAGVKFAHATHHVLIQDEEESHDKGERKLMEGDSSRKEEAKKSISQKNKDKAPSKQLNAKNKE
jgi:MscS family membrane protein